MSSTKRLWVGAWLTVLMPAGCVYDAPVIPEAKLPVDPALLGLWEAGPSAEAPVRMLVLKFSPTEYLVQYPTGEKALFFRAYPIRIGHTDAVQIQFLGTARSAAAEADRKYHVVAYRIRDDTLELRIINTSLIPDTLRSSNELQDEIRKHQDQPELFVEPQRFKRIAG